MNRGSIIVEAVIVVTLTLLMVMLGVRELGAVARITDSYFDRQESVLQEAFEKSVEVIRHDKAVMDGN